MTETTVTKQRRGFAAMSLEKRRAIAGQGGRAAHQKGTAHRWTHEEARAAGRKGGRISRGGRGRLVPPDANASAITDHVPAELPDIDEGNPQPMKGGGEVVIANEFVERTLRAIASATGIPIALLISDNEPGVER